MVLDNPEAKESKQLEAPMKLHILCEFYIANSGLYVSKRNRNKQLRIEFFRHTNHNIQAYLTAHLACS